jgi:hypothetical protein
MTSIPVASLPAPHDETRRDRWGRYLVRPPGKVGPVGYTRATTAAKALDDGGGLAPWKATAACVGSIVRPGLRAQWETLLAAYGPSPWYAGQAAKARCKALVEDCAAAGGATDRREIGTSLHALTALVDVGRPPEHVTPETERDLAGYRATLTAGGVEIVEGMVEVCVVLDDYRVAGTFDRLVVVGNETPMVADLKCGADLSYSWQSIAVQLAIYSRGDAIYRQGPAPDGSEDERLPMPEVDQENGLVIWLDAGTGHCELHLVDLSAGWEAFELSMAARAWRKAVVSMPFGTDRWRRTPAEDEIAGLLADSIAQQSVSGDGPGDGEASPAGAVATVDDARAEVQGEDFTAALRAWLQGRVDAIGSHPQARTDLARSWPTETLAGVVLPVPTLLTSTDHAPEQLAAIEEVLRQVERRHQLRFPEPRPEPASETALVLHMFPGSTTKEQ